MLQEANIVQDWINEGIERGIEKGEVKATRSELILRYARRWEIMPISA